MPAPQFGAARPGLIYVDRPAAFGLAVRDGRLALVEVKKPGQPAWLDLPGGAIEAGETAEAAVVREFGEETGLQVSAGRFIAAADQKFRNTDGAAFNNRGRFFEVAIEGENPALKTEADHTLTWLAPDEALHWLRHEAHAWAVSVWLT